MNTAINNPLFDSDEKRLKNGLTVVLEMIGGENLDNVLRAKRMRHALTDDKKVRVTFFAARQSRFVAIIYDFEKTYFYFCGMDEKGMILTEFHNVEFDAFLPCLSKCVGVTLKEAN